MLTTTEVNRLKSDIDERLLEMERLLPQSSSNTGETAVRYWFLNWLERQVEGRLRRITKQAISLGVIFDHKKQPEPPFTDRIVFADDTVEIRVKVNAPSTRLNIDRLKALLIEGKHIDHGTLEDYIGRATLEIAPAHHFSSTLVEGSRNHAATPYQQVY